MDTKTLQPQKNLPMIGKHLLLMKRLFGKMRKPHDCPLDLTDISSIKYTVLYYVCLVTLVFDIPPTVRSSEIDLILPCSEAEWTAPTAKDWARCRKDPAQRISFADALHSFLDPSVAGTPLDSPFAGLLILHALIQHIWFWRQDRWCSSPELQAAKFRSALDKLEHAAQFGSESTVSPHNSRAALVYSFHSLLRLARVYLCANMGKLLATFRTHNVKTISQAMATQLTVERSFEASQAALIATQSLRVPLRFGVILNSGCGNIHYYFNTLECGSWPWLLLRLHHVHSNFYIRPLSKQMASESTRYPRGRLDKRGGGNCISGTINSR
ncbi:unnamed protein product [Sphagnum balticum]